MNSSFSSQIPKRSYLQNIISSIIILFSIVFTTQACSHSVDDLKAKKDIEELKQIKTFLENQRDQIHSNIKNIGKLEGVSKTVGATVGVGVIGYGIVQALIYSGLCALTDGALVIAADIVITEGLIITAGTVIAKSALATFVAVPALIAGSVYVIHWYWYNRPKSLEERIKDAEREYRNRINAQEIRAEKLENKLIKESQKLERSLRLELFEDRERDEQQNLANTLQRECDDAAIIKTDIDSLVEQIKETFRRA